MNIGIERSFQNNDWITIIVVLVFILLTITKIIYPGRIKSLMGCFFSKDYFLQYSHNILRKDNLFHVLLFLAQNLICSLFLFFILQKSKFTYGYEDYTLFFFLFIIASFYISFLYILGKLIASLFQIDSLFDYIWILKFSYSKVILFYFMPFIILKSYVFFENDNFLSFMIVLILLLLALRWLLIIKNNTKLIIKNLFYFILYICTLEIVPLLILYKIAAV